MAGRPEERTGRNGGGIPDGLLIGLLAFLLGLTLLAWTATGLAGLFAHGAWPEGVTLAETPLSIRRLVTAPHDLPAAWPNTPAGELSGYGLFWGLFIGELMVLVVLVIFVLGSVARWRAVRARRRHERWYGDGHGAENGSKADPVRSRQHREHQEPHRQEPHHQAQPHAPAPAPIPTPAPAAPVEHTPAETTLLIETGSGSGSGSGSETPVPAPVLPRSPPPAPPSSSTDRPQRAAPPSSRPSWRPTAPRSSSPPTPPSGPRRRTPAPSSARCSSTTRATSATPRPVCTGPPPRAASSPRRPPPAPSRSWPRSGRRRVSTWPPPTPPKRSFSAGCMPPPSTAAPSARSTAGHSAAAPTNRCACSAPTPRRPPDSPACWSRH